MQRNAAVVLGNIGTTGDVEVLTRAMGDDEPLAREHAASARGHVGALSARQRQGATYVARCTANRS
jgi:HEAT repeat protein